MKSQKSGISNINKPAAVSKQSKQIAAFAVGLLVLLVVAGFTVFNMARADSNGQAFAESMGGVQVAKMAVNGMQYEPSEIIVKAGQKVRWEIDGTNAEGCATSLFSKSLGINQMLEPGMNIVEFTPTTPGTIAFSCSMGMSRGEFKVV